MELSKDLKKILVTGVALLMTASVMGTGNVANAKHRKYHYRTHRVYRRHARRYYRRDHKHYRRKTKRHAYRRHSHGKYAWMLDGSKIYKVQVIGHDHSEDNEPHVKFLSKAYRKFVGATVGYVPAGHIYSTRKAAMHANKINNEPYHYHKSHRSKLHKRNNRNDQNNSVATNLSEMKQETIKDINQDRENNGIYPLQVSSELNQIANMRAKQELTHYGHIDPNTGYGYANEDAYKLGYNSSPSNQKYGGNLGESFLKETIDNGNGTTSYFKNGKEMADGIENGMMTNDADSNWGHRDNILGHSGNLAYHYLGVGVSHLPNSNKYYVAEDLD